VRVEIGALASQRVTKKHFGGESRGRNAAFVQEIGALLESGLNRQRR